VSTEPLTLEIGKKLSPSEAKAFTDQIKQRMYALWNEKIFAGAFMRDLEAGKLPLETIKLFWRNWYSYPVEVNNFHLIIYQRHQGIFARHRDLLAPYVGKISDELVNPSIPGHIQVLIKQGEAFGVTVDEMINCQVFAGSNYLRITARSHRSATNFLSYCEPTVRPAISLLWVVKFRAR